MSDPTPGNIRNVEQAVKPTQINENSVVGDVLDGTRDQHAFFQAGHGLFLDLGNLDLKQCLPGEHDVRPTAIEGNNPALDLLADVILKPTVGPNINQRSRQKCTNPNVDSQTALDPLQHLAGNGLLIFERVFQDRPDLQPGSTIT